MRASISAWLPSSASTVSRIVHSWSSVVVLKLQSYRSPCTATEVKSGAIRAKMSEYENIMVKEREQKVLSRYAWGNRDEATRNE